MRWYFFFFLVSGFCSILYEVIWLRLTMAQFGVTTAVASIVLSAFMVGLGFGSWSSGRFVRRFEGRLKRHPLRLYALTELLIGVSAVTVPYQLVVGKQLLQRIMGQTSLSGPEHSLLVGAWIVVTLVPWCACMGATFPFAMLAIRNSLGESDRSFSYLCLANVLGALAGAREPLAWRAGKRKKIRIPAHWGTTAPFRTVDAPSEDCAGSGLVGSTTRAFTPNIS